MKLQTKIKKRQIFYDCSETKLLKDWKSTALVIIDETPDNSLLKRMTSIEWTRAIYKHLRYIPLFKIIKTL